MNEELKYRFCDLGMQYYVAGRLAARAGQAPVHGNLLHHAVEMFLKGALLDTVSVDQLRKRPYSHDLAALWDGFKSKESDATLDRFNAAIQGLHAFESIRYPDEIVRKGMATGVAWAPDDISFEGGTLQLPQYIVHINEIDELVVEILRRASVNPKAMTMKMSNNVARESFLYQNPFAAAWGL